MIYMCASWKPHNIIVSLCLIVNMVLFVMKKLNFRLKAPIPAFVEMNIFK